MSEQHSILDLAADLRMAHATLRANLQVLRGTGQDNAAMLAHDLAMDVSRTASLAITAAITAARNADYFVRDQIKAAQAQEVKVPDDPRLKIYEDALTRLALLGNEPLPGNSVGNKIAQDALLAAAQAQEEPK